MTLTQPQRDVLELMASADGRKHWRGEVLARGIYGTAGAVPYLRRSLAALERRGLVARRRHGYWTLRNAGRDAA